LLPLIFYIRLCFCFAFHVGHSIISLWHIALLILIISWHVNFISFAYFLFLFRRFCRHFIRALFYPMSHCSLVWNILKRKCSFQDSFFYRMKLIGTRRLKKTCWKSYDIIISNYWSNKLMTDRNNSMCDLRLIFNLIFKDYTK
jgi:hypothetical protein